MHSTNCHSRSTLATHSPIRFVISLPASTTVPCPPGARQHDDESSDGGVISDDGVREAAARRGIGAHAQEGADRHRALHRLREEPRSESEVLECLALAALHATDMLNPPCLCSSPIPFCPFSSAPTPLFPPTLVTLAVRAPPARGGAWRTAAPRTQGSSRSPSKWGWAMSSRPPSAASSCVPSAPPARPHARPSPVPGWDESVINMQLGEQARITCTPDYAYGAGGFPAWGIMPNSTLVFDIEVLSVQ
ncbi:unnamed protein product [Closterium sp. NIES-64]|nr:unnamed protein product [Closterium sp. NIES-64]